MTSPTTSKRIFVGVFPSWPSFGGWARRYASTAARTWASVTTPPYAFKNSCSACAAVIRGDETGSHPSRFRLDWTAAVISSPQWPSKPYLGNFSPVRCSIRCQNSTSGPLSPLRGSMIPPIPVPEESPQVVVSSYGPVERPSGPTPTETCTCVVCGFDPRYGRHPWLFSAFDQMRRLSITSLTALWFVFRRCSANAARSRPLSPRTSTAHTTPAALGRWSETTWRSSPIPHTVVPG